MGDACPRELAELVLLEGVDPLTHTNPEKGEGKLLDDTIMTGAEKLRRRICVGAYTFSQSESVVRIKYRAGDGLFRLTLNLSHAGRLRFADRLEWSHYTLG